MNDHDVARPLILVLEGTNDCEFLFRLSQRLHAENPQLADLKRLHADGRILVVPTGGGNFDQWAVRFAALGCQEFHLYDREIGPETLRRQQAIELVNSRPGCRGFLTSKRAPGKLPALPGNSAGRRRRYHSDRRRVRRHSARAPLV